MKREPESTMNEAHTPTEFDAPPEVADDQDVDMGSTMIEAPIPEASGAAIPTSETPRSVAQLAPSPAIKATAMDLQSVSKSEAHTVEFSGQETFAAMPAVKPAADGQFRETQWFMAAQDPDHIENIQNVVPSDLEDQYVGGDNKLDTQVREQFSLNVGNSGKSQGSTDVSASSGSARDNTNSGLIVAIIIVAAIGAGAYFMFKG